MDLRKVKSQQKLQKSLAFHLQTKTIDEITISELTKQAGVSRQTFYSNFDSKQSILLGRLEQLFKTSQLRFEKNINIQTFSRTEYIENALKEMLTEYEKEKQLMSVAFTGQAGVLALSLLKGFVSNMISGGVSPCPKSNLSDEKFNLVSELYSGAIIGAIQAWILMPDSESSIDFVSKSMSMLIPYDIDGLAKGISG